MDNSINHACVNIDKITRSTNNAVPLVNDFVLIPPTLYLVYWFVHQLHVED